MSTDICPAAYRPEEFVNREEELDLIKYKVGRACSGEAVDRPVVHFHSAPRIGKTWLLSHLTHLYGHLLCPVSSACRVTAIMVDCDGAIRSDDVRAALFRACKEGWEGETQGSWCERLVKAQDLSALAEALCALLPEHIPLLLLDAADVLAPDDFGWLEEHLIDPLARTELAIIVVAGTLDAPHWRRFETRRRIHYWPLRAFDAGETAEQVRKAGFAVSGMDVYRISGGHPYASRLLVEDQWPLEDDCVAALLQPVEAELLRNVPLKLQDGVRILAVIRRFIHIASLRFFLNRFGPAPCERWSDGYCLRFLRKLEQDQLLMGGPDQYEFVPVVRGMLLQRLRLTHLEMYHKGHHAAIELYQGWMEAYPQDCGRFLLEVTYHIVASRVSAGGSEKALTDVIMGPLDDWLVPRNLTADQVYVLYKSVQDDSELLEMMPSSLYKALLERITRLLH